MPEVTTSSVDTHQTAIPAAEPEAMEVLKKSQVPGKRLALQARLTVGAPDDPLEREADEIADQVMRSMDSANTPEDFIQRKCAHCEEEGKAQRKPLADRITPFIQAKTDEGTPVSDAASAAIQSSRGSGSRMDSQTNNFMSSRFGADLSRVNIHTDNRSAQLNRSLNAKAFTVGNDIYFNEGQYQPQSAGGKTLLAHELTHTLQQGGGQQLQKKPITHFSPLIQRSSPDDEKLLTPATEHKVLSKNLENWEAYQLAGIMPLRGVTPEATPVTYSNRTYRAQQMMRAAKLTLNEKSIGVDGIFGPEMLIFLHFTATSQSQESLKYQIAGLGFDMDALASGKADLAVSKSYTSLFTPKFLYEWDTSGPGDIVFEHITAKDEESSKKWCDSILFESGVAPQNLNEDSFTLGQRYAILKKIYAGIAFRGRAALVTASRDFLDSSADAAIMVSRDPHKTSPNPLRVSFIAQSDKQASSYETWFGLEYPHEKAKTARQNVGVATVNGIQQVTGILVSYYLPPITTMERARIDIIRNQYIADWMQSMDEYVAIKQAAIISILLDEETSWYIIPGKLKQELNSFWNKTPVFEKLLDKLASHPDRNYFDLLVQRVQEWKNIETLQAFVQLCNSTSYKANAQVIKINELLQQMKHEVQVHDYVTGSEAEQGVWINKEHGEGNFMRIGDVTNGMYRITETKERLKEEKRAKLEVRMKELVSERIANGLSDKPVAQKEMNEKELMESVLEQAAKDVGISESDIEEVQYEEAYRLKGVKSMTIAGVEDILVDYERVARIGGEGNKWQVVENSGGFTPRNDFETALGWFKFHNTMKATEKVITYMAVGELVVIGGLVLLSGGGAALVALGGGGKMVGISIGISVLIYAITADHLTVEGFLKAALEGYLFAVGIRLLAPAGAAAAKLIGTATFRQKLLGLILQSVVVGGGSGAISGAGAMLIEDILRGKLRSPGDYLKGAAFGFVAGALFDLGGSLIIGPIFRTAGRSVLERITNIEQLKTFLSSKSIVLSPSQWGSEITNAYAGFRGWMKENIEGKLMTEIAKDAKEKAKAMFSSYADAVDLTIHRQALDLIDAGMTKESAEALEMLVSSSRKSLGKPGSRALVDDMLNQLVKEPTRTNPFFSLVKAADKTLLETLLQGKKLNELANSPSVLRLSTTRSPAETASLMKNQFDADIPDFETWTGKLFKQVEDTQVKILDLLKQRGASVTPKSLLRIAESGTAFSDEVVDGVTRMITDAKPLGISNANIEKMLADLADDKMSAFLQSMGTLPKSDFDDLLKLAAKPEEAARLLNYVTDTGQLIRLLNRTGKNAAVLDGLFQLTATKGKFADDIEYLLGRRRTTVADTSTLITQFHGDAGLARKVFDNLSPHIKADILDKMFQRMSVAGVEGEKLAQVLGANKFGSVDGYIDLVKKASIDLPSIKSVNQALDKAEALSQRGVSNSELRFEDNKSRFHDVDVGIKNPAATGTYLEAYQFKTLDGPLDAGKIQEAAIQLKNVTSAEKILELKCDPSTTAATIETPHINGEMRFQSGLKVPGKGNGITEFHFILSDGTVIIKKKSDL